MFEEQEEVLAQEGAYKLTYNGGAFQVWEISEKCYMVITRCIGVYRTEKEARMDYDCRVEKAKEGAGD